MLYTALAGLKAHKLSDTLCERRRADLVLPRRSPRCDDGGVQSLLVMDPIQRLLLADLSLAFLCSSVQVSVIESHSDHRIARYTELSYHSFDGEVA